MRSAHSLACKSDAAPNASHDPCQKRHVFLPFARSALKSQWLSVFLPFARLLLMVFLPVRVRSLLKKPWRRFRTRWLGLKVSLIAVRTCRLDRAGCASACRPGLSSLKAESECGCFGSVGRVGSEDSIESDLRGRCQWAAVGGLSRLAYRCGCCLPARSLDDVAVVVGLKALRAQRRHNIVCPSPVSILRC